MTTSPIVNLTGTVELIKNEKKFANTFLTEFIISAKVKDKVQHYIIKSFSPGEFDRYAIHTLIGHDVTLDCYLNGRKSEGDKGPYFNNELHVKELRIV